MRGPVVKIRGESATFLVLALSLSLCFDRLVSRPTVELFHGPFSRRRDKDVRARERPTETREKVGPWEGTAGWVSGVFYRDGACSPIVKLGPDHRYQLSRRYPSVIRTLSGTLSIPAHLVLHRRTLSRHHPNHYRALEPYPRERENGSTLNTKTRCCRLLLQTKWFSPRKRVVFTDYTDEGILSDKTKKRDNTTWSKLHYLFFLRTREIFAKKLSGKLTVVLVWLFAHINWHIVIIVSNSYETKWSSDINQIRKREVKFSAWNNR